MAQRTPEKKLGAVYRDPYRVDLGDSNEVYCDPVVVTSETIVDDELWTPIDPFFQHLYEFTRGKSSLLQKTLQLFIITNATIPFIMMS